MIDGEAKGAVIVTFQQEGHRRSAGHATFGGRYRRVRQRLGIRVDAVDAIISERPATHPQHELMRHDRLALSVDINADDVRADAGLHPGVRKRTPAQERRQHGQAAGVSDNVPHAATFAHIDCSARARNVVQFFAKYLLRPG